mmetsp:Transcript_12606/g.18857  ORF Transcript_12606/g.18857 Transcript_12606/m.18857 type:complete len:204 (-) Transcript_12606:93-704(-)
MCMSTREKRIALLSGYITIAFVSIMTVASAIATASDTTLRRPYRFVIAWHAWMTLATLFFVVYWRICRPSSNFFISFSIVSLFMMALQSACTSAASFSFEESLDVDEDNYIVTLGQKWIGTSCALYFVAAAWHLSMMCAWRDIDVDAYEAVPLSVLSGGLSYTERKSGETALFGGFGTPLRHNSIASASDGEGTVGTLGPGYQ